MPTSLTSHVPWQAESWATEVDAVTHVYTKIKTGYTKELTVNGVQLETMEKTLTYGEITSTGADMLMQGMDMTGGVFIDLGSGVGRLVHHVATTMPVKRAMGIELVQERHDVAVRAKEMLVGMAIPMSQVQLILGDLLDLNLDDITHIFICSLCFPDDVLKHVVETIQEGIDQRQAPQPKWLLTQRKLPFKGRYTHVRSLRVPCTWSNAVNFHIYRFGEPSRPA